MSTDPTPADLERARRWLETHGEGSRSLYCDFFYRSLAALLRSVREEGARQERERARCETCADTGEIEDRWLEPTHHPFCDGSCAVGCPIPAERHERAPCPSCTP